MNLSVIMAMVRLRLVRVRRDRMGLVWLLVMPMVFSLVMGELMGGVTGHSGTANLPSLLVSDLDGGDAADQLLAPLADNERFRVVRWDSLVTPEAARDLVEKSRRTAVLLIPDGYTAAVSAGLLTQLHFYYDSDRLSSQTVNTLLNRALLETNTVAAARSLVQTETQADGVLARDRAESFSEESFTNRWQNPKLIVTTEVIGRLKDTGLSLTNTHQHVGPAYVLFFVMMFMMMSSKELVEAREDRTLARLVTSRATSTDLVLGFFLSGMILGLVQSAVLLVMNSLAFGIDYGDSLLGLILVVVLFAGFSAGAAVLLGSIARTGAQADGLGMALTMTMAALGGLWWPLEVVPESMQALGRALPTGQAISIFHDMIGRGYGVAELSSYLIGLTIWFVGALLLGSWKLRQLVTT